MLHRDLIHIFIKSYQLVRSTTSKPLFNGLTPPESLAPFSSDEQMESILMIARLDSGDLMDR